MQDVSSSTFKFSEKKDSEYEKKKKQKHHKKQWKNKILDVYKFDRAPKTQFWCIPFVWSTLKHRIGGVMVSLLAFSAVDREFERWSGQTKDYAIGICCFSTKRAT